MNKGRKIIHVDCDCFYASVEVRDDPLLSGKSVAVGGTGRRGVLSTCNYTARHFGIRSAMPTAWAKRLCPDLIVLPPRFDAYKEASSKIMAIFSRYSDLVEPLSLDEAFIDVTDCELYSGSATLIAKAIREEVQREVGITVSAGVAPNKFLAKIASDWKKPNGLFVITPDSIESFVCDLPVEKIHGVGKVTAERLHRNGLYLCSDIQSRGSRKMIEVFGQFGEHLFQLSCGVDNRLVSISRNRKSVSVERTFSEDIPDLSHCMIRAEKIFHELQSRLDRLDKNCRFNKLFVKVKFSDFTQTTVETLGVTAEFSQFKLLLEQAWKRQRKPVRLMGMGLRIKNNLDMCQLELFPAQEMVAL